MRGKRDLPTLLGLVTLLAVTATGAAPPTLEGFWYGAYLDGGSIGRVSIDSAARTVDLPGSMIFDLPVEIGRSEGEITLRGEIQGYELRIAGQLHDDVLRGTFALGGKASPFEAVPNPKHIIRGRTLPAFEVKSLDGKTKLTNADFAGKYLLIDFWATWCGRCQGELPYLEEAYRKYKDRVAFLSISVDEDPAAVETFRKERSAMPWVHGNVSPDSDLVRRFEIGIRQGGLPLPILVSPEGEILAAGQDELTGAFRIGFMIDRYVKG